MKKRNGPFIPILYNLTMILIFFIIYLILRKDFGANKITDTNDTPSILDIFNLAVTLQTAVGVPLVYPMTFIAKCMTILQQILLIFGNLLILHFMNQV